MEVKIDCKSYHVACRRVNEYLSEFDFLQMVYHFEKTVVLENISKYIKKFSEGQQKYKIQK